ncbi:hypothetical protein [Metallosphaera javensis (ex Sakai et al. 2022)]|uniref:hypothetical protein n=1 Tax=Metallosphaera javensis (ex Sakai et al. 2022) TaxID=2775498 RepID=UPI002590D225|nr:MAG: hypothetical protein MjAS7_2356 [Metallosphaera javensis (ex Sakai et al. 2022)]
MYKYGEDFWDIYQDPGRGPILDAIARGTEIFASKLKDLSLCVDFRKRAIKACVERGLNQRCAEIVGARNGCAHMGFDNIDELNNNEVLSMELSEIQTEIFPWDTLSVVVRFVTKERSGNEKSSGDLKHVSLNLEGISFTDANTFTAQEVIYTWKMIEGKIENLEVIKLVKTLDVREPVVQEILDRILGKIGLTERSVIEAFLGMYSTISESKKYYLPNFR